MILIVLLVLAAALSVFRGILLFSDIDTVNGLYTNARTGAVFDTLLFVLVAMALLAGFYARRFSFSRQIKNESVMAAFAASVCALMMTAVLCANVFDMITGKRAAGALLIAETALCVPSVIYFFRICSKGARADVSASETYSLLPVFPALYTAVRTVTLFIDTGSQINSSQRSFVLLTLVFIMMFFITEAEFSVSHIQKKKNLAQTLTAKYIATGAVVVCLVFAVIAPYTVASAFWIYDPKNLIYNVMNLGFGLYASVRIFSV